MQEEIMLRKFQALPSDKQAEVIDFIDFLAKKSMKPEEQKTPAARGLYGRLKGQITMSDDFDAPLEDFADYM